MSQSQENNGFVLPTADENVQSSTVAAQTIQDVAAPAIHEETASRDLFIAGGIILILLFAFFFAKPLFTHSLVKKRISPSKANMAGWWLFILLASVSIGAVLAAVNPTRFFSLLILGPLGLVAALSAFFVINSSRA